MDGFELLERVVERGIHRPVVFLTAYPDQAKRARAAAVGALACLEKPFDEQTLLRALELAIRPTVDGEKRTGPRPARD
jgi:FixJ family two-component response regulator